MTVLEYMYVFIAIKDSIQMWEMDQTVRLIIYSPSICNIFKYLKVKHITIDESNVNIWCVFNIYS